MKRVALRGDLVLVLSTVLPDPLDDDVIARAHKLDPVVEGLVDAVDLFLEGRDERVQSLLHAEMLPEQDTREDAERPIVEEPAT